MYYIGIDIGGTNVKMGIVDKEGNFLAKNSIVTRTDMGFSVIVRDIGAAILEMAAKASIVLSDIAGVGIGCPGAIDSARGIVNYSNNLRWKDVDLVGELHAIVPLPIKVSNDANVAALGESMFGSAKQYSSSVLITLGTGVGGGIIIDNGLFEGNESKGAEVGHIVISVGGEQCSCGRRGCWEAYSSATALIRDTKRAMTNELGSMMWDYCDQDIEKASGKTAFECAKKGDIAAKKVVDNYLYYLGEGLTNIVNLLRPQAIILGGGICAQGENLTKPLTEYMTRQQYGGVSSVKSEIVIAALGNDAGILGAASLIINAK